MDLEALERAEAELRRHAVAGVFTARMARRAGFTRGAIRYRLARGWWQPVVGDGIVLAGTDIDVHRRVVAARLTYSRAVVIWRTAALLHGFPLEDDGSTHLHVGPGVRDRRGLSLHDVRLTPSDVLQRDGVRITSPVRTVVDCLARLDQREAERLLAWVITREIVLPDELLDAAHERQGRPRSLQLERLAEMAADGAVNGGELALHDLLRTAGLTGWSGDRKITLHGRVIARVDVLFHEAMLILELDGEGFHDPAADQARDALLSKMGYTVLRFTWADVGERPLHVIGTVVEALEILRARRR